MGTIIAFPAERCSAAPDWPTRAARARVIILPVIRIERYGDSPSDGLEPTSSSPRGKRRKR